MFEEEFKKDRARRERVDAGNKICNMQYDSFSLPVKSSIRSVRLDVCAIGCLCTQKKNRIVPPWISMAQSNGYQCKRN